MVSKRRVERDIRAITRGGFKQVNRHKEYAFIILLCIFSWLVFKQPTLEKILIYISGMIGIQFVVIADKERKIKIKSKV